MRIGSFIAGALAALVSAPAQMPGLALQGRPALIPPEGFGSRADRRRTPRRGGRRQNPAGTKLRNLAREGRLGLGQPR